MNGWDLAGILLLVVVVDSSVIWAFSRGCRFCDVDGWGLDLGEVGYQTETGIAQMRTSSWHGIRVA